MHMKDTLANFLYDKEYLINIYDNFIHVFNYKELENLNDSKITLRLNNFKVELKGSELFIIKMNKNELLIKGEILNLGLIYE